jgi:hypothetical protein
VVDAQGTTIPIVDPIDRDPFFQDSGFAVGDDTGQPCVSLCALPPKTAVLIQEGQTVYLPGQVSCFWCNISANTAELEVFAVLSVSASASDFSWARLQGIGTTGVSAGPSGLRASLPGLAIGCRGRTS